MLDLKLVLSFIPDIVFWKDLDGILLGCNLQLSSLLGKSEQQLIGKTEYDMPWGKNLTHAYQIYDQQIIKEKKPILNLSDVVSLRSHPFPQMVTFSRIPIIENNEVRAILVILKTDNDRASNDIVLDTLINSLPYYIFWKDKKSTYIGCNKNFASLLDTNASSIVGRTDFDLNFREDEARLFRAHDQKIMDGRMQVNQEEQLNRPDGSELTVLVSKAPIKNEVGDIIGLLGISTDITQQKNVQKELKQAKTQAEASNEAKSEFIANMSHDIRTPLTGILGLAQSLRDCAENPTQKHDAELLIDATNELMQLFNQVIDVININKESVDTNRTEFSLHRLLEHNISLLRPAAKHKNIDLELHIDSEVHATVIANFTYLDRVVLNLLSNAVKFTHNGWVKLFVKLKSRNNTQQTLEMIFEDTGIGISAKQKLKIFDQFYRASPSYESLYKGSGLGLYLVKQYLTDMGGTIDLTSEKGAGSTFRVILPLNLVSSEACLAHSPKTSNNFIAKPLTYKQTEREFILEDPVATILIVEDNMLAARMARQILRSCNCSSFLAKTGQEALVMAAKKKYDLILMDIGLPDISGIEVALKIRTLSLVHTPIIALTGHIINEKKQQYIKLGLQDVLLKPLTLENVKHLLGAYVIS